MTRNDRRIRCMVVKEGVIFCLWACPRRCTSLSGTTQQDGGKEPRSQDEDEEGSMGIPVVLVCLSRARGTRLATFDVLKVCVLGCPRGAEDELYRRAAGQAGGLSSTASGRVPLK